MIFPNSYFEDEVREGFYIPGMVKRSWAVQMEVLDVVADICMKYGMKWYAHCGTLLGAVRHGGFIPWDDDLDICMLRDDYVRFNEVAQKELPEGYRVLNLDHEAEYDTFLTRIINGQAINTDMEYLKRNHGFPYVAGVDIFPLDYLMPDAAMEEKRRVKAQSVWNLAQAVSSGEEKRSGEEIAECVYKLTGIHVRKDMELQAALLRVLETLFKEYKGENASCVAVMPFYIQNKSHIYPLKCYADSVSMPFETGAINVPAGYDAVLQIEYKRWETVNKKGGLHDYPFFREQERILVQKNGTAPYVYSFAGCDKGIEKERERHAVEADLKAKMLRTINEAHDAVYDRICKKDPVSAMSILSECQNLAITVGKGIEEEYGKGFITVKFLENYCEQVYILHEKLSAGERINVYQEKKKLSKSIGRAMSSYKNDIKRRGEILFMPVRAKDWDSLSELYQEYISDKEADVYVMPLPYFERGDDGNPETERYEYDAFPDDLRLIRFEEYDFEHKHPDMVVIQNPFDEYASAITVHPFFYARNLTKYTNRLIYVQPFRLDETDAGEEKALANAPRYVVVPGVIYSDVVYVPSETMRKVYLDCLTVYMGKDHRRELENKIAVLKTSDEIRDRRTPGRYKKTILFYVSIADIYSHGNMAMRWIKNRIHFFEKCRSMLEIIWISEDEMEENIRAACPDIYDDYFEIRSLFRGMKLGEQVSIHNIRYAISKADAYYGSRGYVMNLCRREKMPVMYGKIKE